MKNLGDKVYTVNAKTNEVDTWEYAGVFKTKDETLIQLVDGKKTCFLPARCVYDTKEKATAVARKGQIFLN